MAKYVQIQVSGEVNEKAKTLGESLQNNLKKKFTAKFIWEVAANHFCSLPEEEVKKNY